MDHADVRYLEAKRTVDDRALSPRVRDRLLAEIPSDLAILEAGPGTGTAVRRLLDWGITSGRYRGVDRSDAVLNAARERMVTEVDAEAMADGFRTEDLEGQFEKGNALDAFEGERADLLVAQSFLDLVPLERAISTFENALRPGGLLYAPLTFDGTTIFQPDHPADDRILNAYHESIADQPGRDPRAGRHVLDRLRQGEGTLLAVDASDWIVHPDDGDYPADERHFLSRILDFVAAGVNGHPAAEDWLAARRASLAAGELSYVAHQYDFLYRTPRS